MNTITLRDMASIIAKAENRPEEKVFNQLKGLAGRNILTAVPDIYGKKGALLFPQDKIYRARMLLAALDNGFAADALAKLDAQMRATSTHTYPAGAPISRNLSQAVNSLDADKPSFWVFEVAQMRMDDGEVDFSGHWVVNGNRFPAHHDWLQIPEEGNVFDFAGTLEAVTSFTFTYLCRPIFNEVKRRNEAESAD